MGKKKFYLPIPVPGRLNCDALTPRPFLATSPKSHPSPYLRKRTVNSKNHNMGISIKKKNGSQGKFKPLLTVARWSNLRECIQFVTLDLHIDSWTINAIHFLCYAAECIFCFQLHTDHKFVFQLHHPSNFLIALCWMAWDTSNYVNKSSINN